MKRKRILAAILAFIMVITSVPVANLRSVETNAAEIFEYLSSDELTGYADSSYGETPASNAVDGDNSTQWHTNYGSDEGTTTDPFPMDAAGNIGSGNDLAQNNNYYIVLSEAKTVKGISVYLQAARNANIKHMNIYVSSEEYTKGADIDWGTKVGGTTGDGIPFSSVDTNTEIALDEVQKNVKSIRFEVTQTYGLNGQIENKNIRAREFGVLATDYVAEEPVYAYLSSDELTGYADSSYGDTPASNAVDGDNSTQWHTNYGSDEGTTTDPFPMDAAGNIGSGNDLAQNNNYYIVLSEAKTVKGISVYLQAARNANIKHMNIYVSSEEYTKGADLDWGEKVGGTTGDGIPFSSVDTNTEIALDAVQKNVKSIRFEVIQTYGVSGQIENKNIRAREFGVFATDYVEENPEEPVFEYLSSDKLTAYADSSYGDTPASNAVDGDYETQWHTNYGPDEGSSDDPFPMDAAGNRGSGNDFAQNNNFYIVLSEAKTVKGISVYLPAARNANIKHMNIYVSSEEYTKGADIDWGTKVGGTTGDGIPFSYSDTNNEVALDTVQKNVKSIRIEVIQTYGVSGQIENKNIRAREFGVLATDYVAEEPEVTEEPTPEVTEEPEVELVFEYLDSEYLTGYADSSYGDTPASNAVDGDYETQWHTNYGPNEGSSDDPFPMDAAGNIGSGNDLAQNNNYYIVLSEAKTVKGISVYLQAARNANIKHMNFYVSSEEYTKGATLDWGEKVGGTTGDGVEFSSVDKNTEIAFDSAQKNVKSIRIEVIQTYGLSGQIENKNIRAREFGVLAATEAAEEPVVTPTVTEEPELVFEYLDSEYLTGYADSSYGDTPASNAVDGDYETQWHTNYGPNEGSSADPFPMDAAGNRGSGNDLAQNNNFYIVLSEAKTVKGISVYLPAARNANIKHMNIYVSGEEYTKGASLDWGTKVGGTTGSGIPFSYSDTNTEIAFDNVQENVKSIRIEVIQTYGVSGEIDNTNIRAREFGVLAGTEVTEEPTPEVTEEPTPEVELVYEYIDSKDLTAYADSSYGDTPASNAVDGDYSTQWHTNYGPDEGSSDDPFPMDAAGNRGSGNDLAQNNNFYIVLSEAKTVKGISVYLPAARNANIKHMNIYVSGEEYTKGASLDWGTKVGGTTGSGIPFSYSDTNTEIAFAEAQENVKSIRIEVIQTYGVSGEIENKNIRAREFGVLAGFEKDSDSPEGVYGDIRDELGEPLFTLAALSDHHIDGGVEKWDVPLRDGVITTAENIKENETADAVVLLGDLVSSHCNGYGFNANNWGSTLETRRATFNKVQEAIAENAESMTESKRVLYVGGNHDYAVGLKDFNSGDYIDVMERNLPELVAAKDTEDMDANAYFQTELPAGTADGVRHVLAYHYNIDGFDFIAVNTPYIGGDPNDGVYNYDLDSLKWIKNKLAEIGEDKTVFFIGHYPLSTDKNMEYGTEPATQAILKDEILDHYPNVIYLYGHEHDKYVYRDTYERVTNYKADGSVDNSRPESTTGFITSFAGSMAYYGSGVIPSSISTQTPNVVQALMIYVYEDCIAFQMKNYGKSHLGSYKLDAYVVKRDMSANLNADPDAVSSVRLSPEAVQLDLNAEVTLNARVLPTTALNRNVTWESSNELVATVDASGNVKAVGYGEAIITVTTEDGSKTASSTITVKPSLCDKIDGILVNDASELASYKGWLEAYEALTEEGKNLVGSARYNKLLEAIAIAEAFEAKTKKLVVKDKSKNKLDVNITEERNASLIIKEGSAALDGYFDIQGDRFREFINGKKNFTIEAEVYLLSAGSYSTIASDGDNTTVLRVNQGKLEFLICDGANWYTASTELNSGLYNTWIHVAGIYNGDTLSVYIEDEAFVTKTGAGAVAASEYDFGVGHCSSDSDRELDGYIRNLRVYSSALTEEELDNKAFTFDSENVELWYDFGSYEYINVETDDEPTEKPLFTFASVSDFHTDAGIEQWDYPVRESVTIALEEIRKTENADLVVVLGDQTSDKYGADYGSTPEERKATFDKVKDTIVEVSESGTASNRVLYATGNHDFAVGLKDFNSGDYVDALEKNLPKLVGAKDTSDVSANAYFQTSFPEDAAEDIQHVLAYHYNIDGFDFIVVNPPYVGQDWGEDFYYDQGSMEWIKNKMESIGKEKTVFIISHYPLQTDVRFWPDGSNDGMNAETHAYMKEEILGQYPRSILLYGHNHGELIARNDTYDVVHTYNSEGEIDNSRPEEPESFITSFVGSMSYFGGLVDITNGGGTTSDTPNIIQALMTYVYEDRIEFQMKNYGVDDAGSYVMDKYVIKRDIESEDEKAEIEALLKEAQAAAEEAKAIAEAAKAEAQAAQAAADEAKAAAEAAQAASAENKEAAEKAKAAAEEAQAKADEAAEAAKEAQTEAEAAQAAAEEANVEAAKEALKAAEEAAKAAEEAAKASTSANEAAQAQEAAQAAQAKAEEAQAKAEEAQAKAETAKEAAEEAAKSSAKDKAAAEEAKIAAENAKIASDAAAQEAKLAEEAAKEAKEAADASNKAAAEEAKKAADAAADAATQATLVAQYAAEAAAAQAAAQEAQAKAEEAQAKAEEAQKKAEEAAEKAKAEAALETAKQQALLDLMLYAMDVDTESMSESQYAAYREILDETIEAIESAEDAAAVETAFAGLKEQVEDILKEEIQEESVFDDVYADWYTDYVMYVYNNGLMTGIKGTKHFAPNDNITKAQVAQVLYNMESQPEVTDRSVFTELKDVYEAEWYANAVAWAYNNNIVTGDLNSKEFSPNADVTREQLALMMYRYAKYKEYDVSASSDLAGLNNVENTSDWALDAVKWAVGFGLISGIETNGEKDLQPQGNATRAQMAAILQRFCEAEK